MKHPVTPDGRYFVVRGRLWRMANPHVGDAQRDDLVHRLMAARRAVRDAKQDADPEAEADAHRPWMWSNGRSANAVRCGGMMVPRISTGTWRRIHHTPIGTRASDGEKAEDLRCYTCSTCARKRKMACKGRSIRMDKLDGLITDSLVERLLQPERALVLSSLKAQRAEKSANVNSRIMELQREVTDAEDRLKRLYRLVEDGVTISMTS